MQETCFLYNIYSTCEIEVKVIANIIVFKQASALVIFLSIADKLSAIELPLSHLYPEQL